MGSNSIMYIELGLKIVVLIAMIFTLFYSFHESTKFVQWIMSLATSAAIFDYIGKFGKGIIFSLVLTGLAVYVIFFTKKKHTHHEKHQ